MVGDAEAGGLDHAEIVGAVADHQRVEIVEIERLAQLDQRRQLGVAPEDRLSDLAGELAVLHQQGIGAVFLKADQRGDRFGEQREAAGDQAGIGAVGAHGADQFAAARRQRDAAFQRFVDDARRQALEQGDALAQGRLERDLAAHGALGDRGDMCLEPGEVGQFVDAFLPDHGGIHVGQKKLLASVDPRLHHNVDRQILAGFPETAGEGGRRVVAFERDIDGDLVEQPLRPAGRGQDRARAFHDGGVERRIGGVADQRGDEGHRGFAG